MKKVVLPAETLPLNSEVFSVLIYISPFGKSKHSFTISVRILKGLVNTCQV